MPSKKTSSSKQNIEKEISSLVELILQGSLESEYELAKLYLSDNCLNLEKALIWLKSAAVKGHVKAQKQLINIYSNPNIQIPHNETREDQAFSWAKTCALSGDTESQMVLGSMYFNGKGVIKDESEGIKWLELAKKSGDMDATVYLGLIYSTPGDFFNRDLARENLFLAAQHMNSFAVNFLAINYWSGLGEVIEVDQEESFRWAKIANKIAPHPKTLIILYKVYSEGILVKVNKKKALGFIQEVIKFEKDSAYYEACYILGNIYIEGYLTKADFDQAIKYLNIASKKIPQAKFKLAQQLEIEETQHFNLEKSFSLYCECLEDGIIASAHKIGLFYENGSVVRQDFELAASYYQEAIEGGYYEAAFDLSQLYWRGLGVPKSITLAYRLMDLCHTVAANHEERNQLQGLMDKILSEMTLKEFNALNSGVTLSIPDDFDPREYSDTLH